ncbi:hypothetical protein WKI65_38185 [Streptomyces sp. MS1.AVA.3]|uniref:hypothetical protein n=1 Tax=Streptomyces decoyicus TaxID=249567 RepID=UPI0030C57417
MPTPRSIDAATASVHTHLDAHHEGYEKLAILLQDLVSAARTGDEHAIDKATLAIYVDEDALYGEAYTDLAELLDDVIAAVRAETAAQAHA